MSQIVVLYQFLMLLNIYYNELFGFYSVCFLHVIKSFINVKTKNISELYNFVIL